MGVWSKRDGLSGQGVDLESKGGNKEDGLRGTERWIAGA